ncbi:MAG: two-component regulator propeller domain-containing protein [Bryobacteraceae bacterium]
MPAPFVLAAAWAAILHPAVHARDPHRLLEQYIHDGWTEEQGYPGGAVHAFAQTPDGFLWIGAENGLVRFDGLTFRIFNHANTDALPASGVLALAADREGGLWILMQSRQVLRYRGGGFEPIARENGVTAIAPGALGDLLLVRPEDTMRYAGGKYAPISPAPGYTSRLVISVAEAPDGTVWMGTRDFGAFALRDGKAFDLRGLRDRKVDCLLSGDSGAVWLGTDRGLALWNGKELAPSGIPAAFETEQVSAMARDRDGNLWLATPGGLARLTPQRTFERDVRKAARPEAATAVFEDREGNLWVGRTRGLERWRDRLFLSFPSPGDGDPENSGPLYTDPSGAAWFSPSTGGLYRMKGTDIREVTEAGIGRDVIYSIDGAPGELWMGRQRGGLTHLRYGGESWAAETFTAADGLAPGPVYTVHRCRDGTVWAGTWNAGVSRIRAGRVTTYTTAAGLASNTVSAIEEGADGTVWFATANGLSAFAADRWRTYTSAQGLPPANINCLLQDSAGILWIGTGDGLAFLRDGRVQPPRDSGDPLADEIFGIADDGLGYLWVTTSKHVARVPRARLLDRSGAAPLREFGPSDGVPAPQGVRRDRSIVNAAGRIWLSLRHGISVVEPARLTANSAPAIMHIESVSADGNPLDPLSPLRIPAGRLRIRFDYLALSLSAPDQVKYRYRLDPLDRDWNQPTSERGTVYMNLRPGPYRFRVVANNSAGLWNSAEADVAMEIVPAFTQTWKFRSLAIAAVALAAFGFYCLRVRRITKELHIGFEERLDERTRIAQELHDTLLQGLLATSMQLQVAVGRLPADSAALSQFRRVVAMLQQVVNESRNAVRGLRTRGSAADDLERALANVREELAAPESIGLRMTVDGDPRPLNPLIRDQVYRIGREGLSNAFRHSGAPMVELEIHYGASDLRLTVRDAGRGIDAEVLRSGRDGHFGLLGMRECAERIGARFKVRSQRGSGTELELIVPAPIAFARPDSRHTSRWRFWRRPKTAKTTAVS